MRILALLERGVETLHRETSNRHLTSTAVVAVVFFAGAALRLFRLGHESIWLDEALSIDFVTREYTTLGLLFELPLQDPHPPLYYLLLDGWVFVFGTSAVAVRLLSALFGIASVVLIYLLGKKVFDETAGITAALLLAFSRFHIYYAQEARMYTLLAALTLVSYYFLVDVVDADTDHDWRTIAGYVIATVLVGYTHVYGFFIILAQNLYVFGRMLLCGLRERDRNVPQVWAADISVPGWIGLQTSVAVLLGPWILILLRRVFTISNGGGSQVSWIEEPSIISIPFTLYVFFFNDVALFTDTFWVTGAVGLFLITVGTVAVVVRREDGRLRLGPPPGVILFATLLLTPLVGAYVVSVLVKPIYINRYLIGASLGLFLLIGAGVSVLWRTDLFTHFRVGSDRLIPFRGRYVVVVCVLIVLMFPLTGYYAADQKEQWSEAVDHVETSASSDAVVVVTNDYVISPYRYYSERSDLTVKPVADGNVTDRFVSRLDGHSEVWVVSSHANAESVVVVLTRSNEFRTVESHEDQYNNIQLYRFERTNNESSDQ